MDIKVCTFNLRVDNEVDGINRFTNRRQRVLDTLAAESPDLIGFQEAHDNMREWLEKSLLGEYLMLGCGRDKNYRGEATVIAVRRSAFDVISSETFWLSFTPSVPGSRFGGDQSSCPRVCTTALLKPRGHDKCFRIFNTHLDHKGDNAKLLGISQIMQRISSTTENFVLTGDFNVRPDSQTVAALNGFAHEGRQVTDATAALGGTCHNFGRREPVKIDYIFTDAEALSSYIVEDIPVDGVYISDHNPVCAVIRI